MIAKIPNQNMAKLYAAKIKKYLDKKGMEPMVLTSEESLKQFNSTLTIITLLTFLILLISLFVSAVVVVNSEFTSALSKIREIAVMKAIGAKNRELYKIFVYEGLILGSFSFVLASFAAVFLIKIINFWLSTTNFSIFSINPVPISFFVGAVFSLLTTTVGALIPAHFVLRKRLIDALNYE
jgi:putative ABC transport system permease protein